MSVTKTEFERSGSNFLLPTEKDNTVTAPREEWYDEESGEKKCHDCGNWYGGVAQHWSMSDCDRPELTAHQEEIIQGMMLGDGAVVMGGAKYPYFKCSMTFKPFVEWLANELGYIMTGTLTETDGELFEVEGGITEDSDCLDQYSVQTHTLPVLQNYRDEYEWGDEDRFDLERFDISPMILKLWHCSDGEYYTKRDGVRIHHKIYSDENWDSVLEWFGRIDTEPYRSNRGDSGDRICLNQSDTDKFFEYIGEPLPGMSYKWPGGSSYEKAKENNCTYRGEPYSQSAVA